LSRGLFETSMKTEGGITLPENIRHERHDDIALLTINRPEKGNSLPRSEFIELAGMLREMESDRSLKAVVITGAGSKFFCAGLDIGRVAGASSERGYWEHAYLQNAITTVEEFSRPVIAAVNGTCVGIGTELILACDIRLASATAKFSIPEVRLGVLPDCGGTQRLTRLVGYGQAKRLIFSAMTIDAVEAVRIGLAEQVLPPDQLLKESMALAKKIAENAPVAVRLAKRAINMSMEMSLRAGINMELSSCYYCLTTNDMHEATSSFLEKRKPQFKEK